MASSETEASPPSRRRPPQSQHPLRNWTSRADCNSFVNTLQGPSGAARAAEAAGGDKLDPK